MTKENQTQQPVSGAMTDEQIIETVREIVERDGYDVQDDHQAGLVEAVAVATVRAILSRAQDAQAIRNAALEALRDAVTEAANEWAGYVEVDTAPRVCAAHIGEAFDKAVISLKPYPAAQIGGNVLDALTSALDCWECEHLLTDAVVEKMRHALQSTPAQPVERPDELAYIEACNLAKAIYAQHYREGAEHWRVLPDLRGVISQISNMVAGMTRKQQVRGNAQEPVAIVNKWMGLLDVEMLKNVPEGTLLYTATPQVAQSDAQQSSEKGEQA